MQYYQQPYQQNNSQSKQNPFALSVVQIVFLAIYTLINVMAFAPILWLSPDPNITTLASVYFIILMIVHLVQIYFWMTVYNGGKIFKMNRDYTIHLYNQKEKLDNKLENLQSNKSQLEMINMAQNK
ncbi:MAG: hypothetical protein AB3N34_01475 [Lettuce witches'-broom phytoplasma]